MDFHLKLKLIFESKPKLPLILKIKIKLLKFKIFQNLTWLAKPCNGPAKPFIEAANDKYGSDNALPTLLNDNDINLISIDTEMASKLT